VSGTGRRLGIGALPSLQSLVAVLSDAVLPEGGSRGGVDRGFPL